MAADGPESGRLEFECNGAAEAAAFYWIGHGLFLHTSIVREDHAARRPGRDLRLAVRDGFFERDANAFAVCLLPPKAGVECEGAGHFGVGVEA